LFVKILQASAEFVLSWNKHFLAVTADYHICRSQDID